MLHTIEEALTFVVTPRGQKFMVPLTAREIKVWLDKFSESGRPDSIIGDAPDAMRDLFGKLLADGCLIQGLGPVDPVWLRAPSPSLDVKKLKNMTVVLTGDGVPLEALMTVLGQGYYKHVGSVDFEHYSSYKTDSNTLLIAAFTHPALEEFNHLDKYCSQRNIPWLPLRYQDGRIFVGPVFSSKKGSTQFNDVFLRRRAAERDVRVHDVSWSARPQEQQDPNITSAEWQWIAAITAIRLERWAAGAYGANLLEMELEIDPVENSVLSHPVMPLPDKVITSSSRAFDKSCLVDKQTGIITQIREVTGTDGLPNQLKVAVADVADMQRIMGWANDRRAFGASWVSLEAAFGAATGEAVERYCGNWVAPDREIRITTYESLIRAGCNAIDPNSLALYSDQQHQAKGFPFTKFNRNSEAGWVLGWSLTFEREVWVPAFLVYVTWHKRQHGSEPLFAYPNLTGIAAGETAEYAMLSGLEEVIERDSGMIWWAHAQPLAALPVTEAIQQLYTDVAHRFELRLIPLQNEFSVPVLAAVVRDKETGWMTIGSAVRHTAHDGAFKALAEAFSLQQTCRSLDHSTRYSNIVQSGEQNLGNLKPWRQDRCYMDSYRSDFHDVVDLMCQQQLHLDKRAGEYISKWVWDTGECRWESLPSLPSRKLEVLREPIERAGYEIISVGVTTSDIKSAGLHVRRTLVPGLVANFPAAFPQWGKKRIQQAGVTLGWRSQPCDEQELNTFPMPHA